MVLSYKMASRGWKDLENALKWAKHHYNWFSKTYKISYLVAEIFCLESMAMRHNITQQSPKNWSLKSSHVSNNSSISIQSSHWSHALSGGTNLHPIILPLVPCPFWGGYCGQVRFHVPPWGYPSQAREGNPSQDGVLPFQPGQGREGYPGQVRMGYPLPSRSRWGSPHPQLGQDGVYAVYAAVATPLAVSRRTFLWEICLTDRNNLHLLQNSIQNKADDVCQTHICLGIWSNFTLLIAVLPSLYERPRIIKCVATSVTETLSLF